MTKSKGRPIAEMGLSDNKTAMRDLEVEIDRINAAMQDLSDKRRSLQTQRNSKLPFFSLAPKICVVIFSFACHKGRLSWNRQLVTTPLVISSVCRAWRDMAHSAPELWNSVSLCVDPSTEGSAIQAELLDQWLRLAQTLPLSITITFNEKDVYKWNPHYEGYMPIPEDGMIITSQLPIDVISVAASYSRQWESLDIFLPSAWAETLDSTKGRISNLRALSIQFVPYNYLDPSSFPKTFLDAPNLRTLTSECESTDMGPFPYHQLEKLTLWSSKTASFLAVLEKCSNLTSCKIIERRRVDLHPAYSHWQPAQITSVQLPKLVSLEISSSRLLGLLADLVAPALEDIVISLGDVSQVEVFSAFLNRSNIVLKRLSIINDISGEENLLTMLSTLTHLSHLELSGVDSNARWRGLSRKFLDYLGSPDTTSGTSFPLPCLKSFKYRGRLNFGFLRIVGEEDEFDIGTLEKALLARWNAHLCSNGVSRLQTFCMSISSWYGPSKVVFDIKQSPVVKDLIKEGMDLVFESVIIKHFTEC